jgi:hypothetical protein
VPAQNITAIRMKARVLFMVWPLSRLSPVYCCVAVGLRSRAVANMLATKS